MKTEEHKSYLWSIWNERNNVDYPLRSILEGLFKELISTASPTVPATPTGNSKGCLSTRHLQVGHRLYSFYANLGSRQVPGGATPSYLASTQALLGPDFFPWDLPIVRLARLWSPRSMASRSLEKRDIPSRGPWRGNEYGPDLLLASCFFLEALNWPRTHLKVPNASVKPGGRSWPLSDS